MASIPSRTPFVFVLFPLLAAGTLHGQESGAAKTPQTERVIVTAPPLPSPPPKKETPSKAPPDEPIISPTSEKAVTVRTHLTMAGSNLPSSLVYYKGYVYTRGPQDLPVRLVTYKGYVYAVIPINRTGSSYPDWPPEIVRLGRAGPSARATTNSAKKP